MVWVGKRGVQGACGVCVVSVRLAFARVSHSAGLGAWGVGRGKQVFIKFRAPLLHVGATRFSRCYSELPRKFRIFQSQILKLETSEPYKGGSIQTRSAAWVPSLGY